MTKVFLVGGAVRDTMLGRAVKDNDFVVVGSTPEEMLSQGFTQVGADFPVFLHPVTGDEYALARAERKTGHGYHGFEVDFNPNVTLEEDLKRRDLTVNALAMDLETNELFDPFNGQADLNAKVLRPVSNAFREDPVRALRAARFQARFGPEWTMSNEVHSAVSAMAASNEFSALTKERVMLEVEKALSEEFWFMFFESTVTKTVFSQRMGKTVDLSVTDAVPGAMRMNVHQFAQANDAEDFLRFFGASNEMMQQVAVSKWLANPGDSKALSDNLAKFSRDLDWFAGQLVQLNLVKLAAALAESRKVKFADFSGANPKSSPSEVRQAMEAFRANVFSSALQ